MTATGIVYPGPGPGPGPGARQSPSPGPPGRHCNSGDSDHDAPGGPAARPAGSHRAAEARAGPSSFRRRFVAVKVIGRLGLRAVSA